MSKGGKLSKAALEGWPPPTSSVSNTGLCAASHLGSDQLPLCRIMVLCRETEGVPQLVGISGVFGGS